MMAYEHTDYMPQLEIGTLLLKSSTATGFVAYESKDDKTMQYKSYLPPNCSLYPVERVLKRKYKLKDFLTMAMDFNKVAGGHSEEEFLKLWTFAYYTGQRHFSSADVYVATDGVNFYTVPLFNYAGAFSEECSYESIKPPERAFQVNWHFFKGKLGSLQDRLPAVRDAIAHFTQPKYYR